MVRLSLCGVVLLALASSGFVRADARLPHASSKQPSVGEGLDEAIDALQRQESELRDELQSLAGREQAAQRRMVARGRAFYRMVRVGCLPAGGGFAAILDHAIELERARRALDGDVAASRALADRKLMVARQLNELVARRGPLELERNAATRARALAGESDDRKRSFERAFETSTGAGEYVAIYGAVGGSSSLGGPAVPTAEGFRSLKGKLPFPIAGRAEVRRVRRPGAPGPGLEMQAEAGTAVRAVAAGRVAFADRYDPFGQIVILDHGDHYYTVMGDLGAIDVRVGDDLSVGAKVGSVGSGVATSSDRDGERSATRPRPSALYFEVRRGATAVDPSLWLGL